MYELDHPLDVWVSFRKGPNIFWTHNSIMVRAGNWVITDGARSFLMRCGNEISWAPRFPAESVPPSELETPVDQDLETPFTFSTPHPGVPPVGTTPPGAPVPPLGPEPPSSPPPGGPCCIVGIPVPPPVSPLPPINPFPPPIPTPEPSTLILFGGGLVLIARRFKNWRKA